VEWSPDHELRRFHPDVLVHRCRLDEGEAWWCPAERVILIDERLSPREELCALAHEVGHARLGHVGCHEYADQEWLAQRIELAADRWAAERLVSFDRLRAALAAYPDDLAAVSDQLGVTDEVLATRLQMLDPRQRQALLRTVHHVA
jgi:Zn-dependent peptidase ImmA (M78 family)